MAYLIIPIVCFVLLAGLSWALLSPFTGEKVWKRRIDDLDPILSVLMTAGSYEPNLVMKVPRGLTSMTMTFPGSVVRLEIPLVTQRQKNRTEIDMAILRDHGLNPTISGKDGEQDIIECEIEGAPTSVSAIIKDAFVRIFDPDPGKAVEFRAFVHLMDQRVVDQALTKPHGLRNHSHLCRRGCAERILENQPHAGPVGMVLRLLPN